MFYASIYLQGFIVRLLAWKRSVFRGNSVRFIPEIRWEVRKHSAPARGAGGVTIDGIRAWLMVLEHSLMTIGGDLNLASHIVA